MDSRLVAALLAVAGAAAGQTTQGMLLGRVLNRSTGLPVPEGATVHCENRATNTSLKTTTDSEGHYAFPVLPPGLYRLAATAAGFQRTEIHELDLAVSGYLEQNFALRPLTDLFEQGRVRNVLLGDARTLLNFYGSDVDMSRSTVVDPDPHLRGDLIPSVSHVVDPLQIRNLPLAGRDVYTSLLLLPGVTADTATTRGIGASSNGQRPSSSSFLLDGFDNNNELVTGPLLAIPPESVQEYRISLNSWSAEYGRNSGYVANAVTQSGGTKLHGVGWMYAKNRYLNANDPQRNLGGLERLPLYEVQTGFQAGGAIARSVFGSASLEYLRSRSRLDKRRYYLPSTELLNRLATDRRGGAAAELLLRYRPQAVPALPGTDYGQVDLLPTASADRFAGLARVDVLPGGRFRYLGRLVATDLSRPDFQWTPYPEFLTELRNRTTGAGLTITHSSERGATNEFRAGWSTGELRFDRPFPEIPPMSAGLVTLPGAGGFYDYRNAGTKFELAHNLTWQRGRQTWKAGGTFLRRRVEGYLTAGSRPKFDYADLPAFLDSRPWPVLLGLSRTHVARGIQSLPDYQREYGAIQFAFYGQNSIRLTNRFSLSLGVRYDAYGAPRNAGQVRDAQVRLGLGNSFRERLSSAELLPPEMAPRLLYEKDWNDFGGRAGFAWSLGAGGGTVLRGAYGTYYDRIFDNLWLNVANNNFRLMSLTIPEGTEFSATPAPLLGGSLKKPTTHVDRVTMFQPGLRTPYVHSAFLGLQHRVSRDLVLETTGAATLGRKLITTDLVNRFNSDFTIEEFLANPDGRQNPKLPDVSYRGNQGSSHHAALIVSARYRTRYAFLLAAWTWSHTIDNQSEPLAGEFDDLSVTQLAPSAGRPALARFTRETDSSIDRGNADFDQRHNVVLSSTWTMPPVHGGAWRWLRNWHLSTIAAFRSGFPFSVYTAGEAPIANARASLLPGQTGRIQEDVPGGKRLLNPAAFATPPSGTVGNTDRNAFGGPGFYNVDLSIARTFAATRVSEVARVTVRADFFNVLNHANLNTPLSVYGDPADSAFGVARYGRAERDYGIPLLTPLRETARQIQLMLRFEF